MNPEISCPVDFTPRESKLIAIIKKMEWSAIEAEEDWKPDGNQGDTTYEFHACCPVCRGRRRWARDGDPIGHKEGCEMGELCKP